MRARLLVAATAAALVVGVVVTSTRTPAPRSSLPVVRVDFPDAPLATLLASARDDGRGEVKVHFTDVDGSTVAAKAGRRGFSAWHHGDAKPSLRIEQRAAATPRRPRWVELSRPEDPLALGNWLPDRLCDQLGLLHAATSPVHLHLDGRDHGVYLRSLRPGDDLAAAAGRARGTFWKGDAIGERRRADLWAEAGVWRRSGAAGERADGLLHELLALLQQPADAANLAGLGSVLDLDAAARAQAIAVLTASNHADRAHNHVWFADPTKDQLEPLLWDANAFGMHAEPTLPVDVARHPLAERLLCDPSFVHARNERLWQLLGHDGGAEALVRAATAHQATLAPVLADDPEIARLRLRRGEFVAEPVAASELPQELAHFAAFVRARQRLLHDYFADARVAVVADPADARRSLVTVFGHVAVRIARMDGAPIVAADGRDVRLLWPGLSQDLQAAPQHRAADGHGVPAPHATPAPLAYTIAAPATALRFCNAFTGDVVTPTAAPTPVATRSVHPWQSTLAPPQVTLGPGPVRLDTSLDLGPATTLTIVAGTQLQFVGGASIRTRGAVQANGTAEAPITIAADAGERAAIACVRGPVRLLHVDVRGPRRTLLSLHGCDAHLEHCTLRAARGDGLSIAGGHTALVATDIALCRGHALVAHAGATVRADGGRFAFADHGVVVRDEAIVRLQGCEVTGNMVGVLADAGCGAFAGGTLVLEGVRFHDSGRRDVATAGDGVVEHVAKAAAHGPPANPPR